MPRFAKKAFLVITLLALLSNARAADASPVTITDDGTTYTLANGILSARINKRGGTIVSLKYRELDLVRQGYWSQVGKSPAGEIGRYGSNVAASIRTDPRKNEGARAEVSCTCGYESKTPGVLPCDVELRYVLAKGESTLYVYAIWEHKPGYPSFGVGEARMALKLNGEIFDFLGVDEKRLRVLPSGRDWDKGEPLNLKEARRMTTGVHKGEAEHKYDYSAILGNTPAYGWASTTKQVGLWLINPSIEYLAGGPTKVELTGHLDVGTGGAPTLLNMWHGSHYGGSSLSVAEDEAWSKVIGPFALYCNSAPTPEEMWKEANTHAKSERRAWPYAWVNEPLYPPASERGTVTGKIVLNDPQASSRVMKNLQAGLASPPYKESGTRGGSGAVDWQRDSKHYQFWTKSDDDSGAFTIRNIRPGTYTLYAFADGVLGEYAQANVVVAAGKEADLGTLEWKPIRHGKMLWELGIANRSAEEFRHGDDYWHWGLPDLFPKEFPNGVNFVIGKSDIKKDWNYAQFALVEGNREAKSTWSITFELPPSFDKEAHGKATLRVAIAGSRLRNPIEVLVNDKVVGDTGPLPDTGVLHRDGIRGYWCERAVAFDAASLKSGTNVLKLRISGNSWVNGVLYDYLRLEVDEAAKP